MILLFFSRLYILKVKEEVLLTCEDVSQVLALGPYIITCKIFKLSVVLELCICICSFIITFLFLVYVMFYVVALLLSSLKRKFHFIGFLETYLCSSSDKQFCFPLCRPSTKSLGVGLQRNS